MREFYLKPETTEMQTELNQKIKLSNLIELQPKLNSKNKCLKCKKTINLILTRDSSFLYNVDFLIKIKLHYCYICIYIFFS